MPEVESPGSGNCITLTEVAHEMAGRFLSIFEKNEHGDRMVFGPYNWFYKREENKNLVLFHEYFHGDTLMGLGASHQTGWTALVVNLLYDYHEEVVEEKQS